MRIRLFGFLLFSLACAPAFANPHGYIQVKDPAVLLEQLVNHADHLVTNINLTRTNGFRIVPVLIENITAVKTCWSARFYADVLATTVAVQKGGADGAGFEVGQLAKNFSIKVIQLNEIALNVGPSQMLADQWGQVNFAYFNAISAANFYLDALIRGQRLNQWPWLINNPALLQRRINLLMGNIAAIQDVMYQIRYAAIFRFRLDRGCIECTFRPHRIVGGPGVPAPMFPYYANNQVVDFRTEVAPQPPPAQFQSSYNAQQWGGVMNNVDQAYLGGPQAAPMGGGQGAIGPGPGGQTNAGFGGQSGYLPGQSGPGQGGVVTNPIGGGARPPIGQGGQPGYQPGQGAQPGQQPGNNGGVPLPAQPGGNQQVNPQIPQPQNPVPDGGFTPGKYEYN